MSDGNKFSYGYIRFYMRIKSLTGLRIGGRKETIEIGAIDNPVIKGVDGFPYIPGSSLKGKLRSLVEKINTKFDLKEGEPYGEKDKNPDELARNPEYFIIRIFGNHKGDVGLEPRIIVRDFVIDKTSTSDSLKVDRSRLLEKIYELKQENVINRIEGKAEHPREIERVVPGVIFKGEIVYKLLGWTFLSKEEVINQVKKEIEELKKAIIYLMKYDYLGGSGTRGYGKVSVYIDRIEIKLEDNQGVIVISENGSKVEGSYDISIKGLIETLQSFFKEINEVAKIEEENYK